MQYHSINIEKLPKQIKNVTLHAKRGLKSLRVNREIYFMVSLRETKISRCEFKISRRVHPGLNFIHSA